VPPVGDDGPCIASIAASMKALNAAATPSTLPTSSIGLAMVKLLSPVVFGRVVDPSCSGRPDGA
jgi:hypothetical protein